MKTTIINGFVYNMYVCKGCNNEFTALINKNFCNKQCRIDSIKLLRTLIISNFNNKCSLCKLKTTRKILIQTIKDNKFIQYTCCYRVFKNLQYILKNIEKYRIICLYCKNK